MLLYPTQAFKAQYLTMDRVWAQKPENGLEELYTLTYICYNCITWVQ